MYNPGNASRVHKVCVNNPIAVSSLDNKRGLGTDRLCNMHTATRMDVTETGGDLDGISDYNDVIFDWVRERLEDEPPPMLQGRYGD